MRFSKSLKLLCDICFYMTFVNIIGSTFGATALWITLPIFALSAFLAGIFTDTKLLKFTSILAVFACFLVVPINIGDIIVLSLPIIYIIYSVIFNNTFRKIEYAPMFKLYGGLLAAFMMFIIFVEAGPLFATYMLPFISTFIIGSIALMRLSRHDEDAISSHYIKIANIVYIGLVILGAVVVGFNLRTIYFRIIYPIIIFPIMGLVRLFGWSFGWLYGFIDRFETAQVPTDERIELEGYQQYMEDPEPSIVTYIIISAVYIIVAAILIAIIVLVIKKVKDNSHRGDKLKKLDSNQTRFNLSKRERSKLAKAIENNQVREIYRKFLLLCKKRGIPFAKYTTSLDVERRSIAEFKDFDPNEMRDIYINVRYGEKEYDKDDLDGIKKVYKNAKKATKRSP